MPCAFSRIEISTVTPVTMMITRHGILLDRLPIVRAFGEHEKHRTGEGGEADIQLEEDDADQDRGNDRERGHLPSVERLVGFRSWEKRISIHDRRRRSAAREQLQPAEQEIAAERDRGMRQQVGQIGLRGEATHADSRHESVDDDPGRRER